MKEEYFKRYVVDRLRHVLWSLVSTTSDQSSLSRALDFEHVQAGQSDDGEQLRWNVEHGGPRQIGRSPARAYWRLLVDARQPFPLSEFAGMLPPAP